MMTRRSAIAALVALPGATRLSTAHVKADDVIVVECDGHLTETARMQLIETLRTVWPGRSCVVLPKGMTLKVVARGV